ncbi:MAG TPA: MFS transporter [Anaerolineaceae bacterium]|nr:MFS transporter [Anaerolineaceae bacterium]
MQKKIDPSDIIKEDSSSQPDLPPEESNHDNNRHVAAIAAAHSLHDMYAGFLPPLLPILIEKLGLSNLGGGSLTLFYSLPSLFQPLIGSLADRHNLKILVILAPLIMVPVMNGARMSLLGLATTPVVMMAMLVLAGLSSASLHAIGPALNSKYAGQKIGKSMSFWVNAGTLGYALGSILLVTVYDFLGLSKLPILAIGGAIASLSIWAGLKNANTCAGSLTKQKNSPRHWGRVLKVMLPIAFIVATRAMMTVMLSTYFPAFLRERGASTWVSGAGMTLLLVAGAFGSYVVGSLSDRFSRLHILAFVTTAHFSAMLIFLRTNNWLQIPFILVIGFLEIAALPVLMAMVQDGFVGDRAFINGLFLSINFVGTSLAVPLVGRLADLYSFQTAFQLAAWILPFGLLGMGWIYRIKKTSRQV